MVYAATLEACHCPRSREAAFKRLVETTGYFLLDHPIDLISTSRSAEIKRRIPALCTDKILLLKTIKVESHLPQDVARQPLR